jgi:hypothetical protein
MRRVRLTTTLVVASAVLLPGCRELPGPVEIVRPSTSVVATQRADLAAIRELPEFREVTGFLRGQHLIVEGALVLNDWSLDELEQPGGWHISGYFGAPGRGITRFFGHRDGRWIVATADGEIMGHARVHPGPGRFRLQVPLRALGLEGEGRVFWHLRFWEYPLEGYSPGRRSYGGYAERRTAPARTP